MARLEMAMHNPAIRLSDSRQQAIIPCLSKQIQAFLHMLRMAMLSHLRRSSASSRTTSRRMVGLLQINFSDISIHKYLEEITSLIRKATIRTEAASMDLPHSA